MDIGGLGRYDSYYSEYKIQTIPTVDADLVSQKNSKIDSQTPDTKENSSVQASTGSIGAKEDSRSKIANLENVSLTFNQNDSFDYIGKDSDPVTLDMQKAISEMQKDKILEEYQYFVGNAQNLFSSQKESSDGLVFAKL